MSRQGSENTFDEIFINPLIFEADGPDHIRILIKLLIDNRESSFHATNDS